MGGGKKRYNRINKGIINKNIFFLSFWYFGLKGPDLIFDQIRPDQMRSNEKWFNERYSMLGNQCESKRFNFVNLFSFHKCKLHQCFVKFIQIS